MATLAPGIGSKAQADEWPALPVAVVPKGKGVGKRAEATEIAGKVAALGFHMGANHSAALGEETTDAGSTSASEAESTCSSTTAVPGTAGGARRMRRRPTALCCSLFDGTVLEPIPGTPVAKAGSPQRCRPAPQAVEAPPVPPGQFETVAPEALAALAPAAVLLSHAPPPKLPAAPALLLSPKRRARDATMARARRDAVPLKVKVPAYDSDLPWTPPLDPTLPVKKYPAFQEFAGVTASALKALRALEPGVPVKKQATSFLLDEPPRVLQPPPGLLAQPR